MPRRPRFYAAHIPVHVIQRGNNRGACFAADTDRHVYLDMLRAEAVFRDVAVHAYVLMTNHVHVLMTPATDRGVTQVMTILDQRYVQYVNRRYERVGTLWQGRYKSCLVEAGSYLLACHRYIENNPVRAGMVAAAGDYRWSSYAANALGAEDALITPHPIVEALDPDPERRRQLYRDFVDTDPGPGAWDAIREATRGGRPLGLSASMPALAQRRPPGRPRRGENLTRV